MRELPDLLELFELLDVARMNGFEGSYDEFKYLLMNEPAKLPLPDKAFALGGLVSLINRA